MKYDLEMSIKLPKVPAIKETLSLFADSKALAVQAATDRLFKKYQSNGCTMKRIKNIKITKVLPALGSTAEREL